MLNHLGALANNASPQTVAKTATISTDSIEYHAIFSKMYHDFFGAGHGIWIWEPPTDTLHFNEAYMHMLGYKEHTFPYHITTWGNLIHEEDKEFTINTQKNILRSPLLGDSFESRYRLRMKNGQYRWVVGKGFVVRRDERGQAIIVVGVHIDLLAVDNSLKQHIIQHDRMHFALEAAKDGLWDWDSQTNAVYYSPRYLEMLGYDTENFPPVFESWASRVHPDDLESTVEMQLAVAASPDYGDVFECIYRFLAADGT